MPELAEIKIMSEYINEVCSGHKFVSITTSDAVKHRMPMSNPCSIETFTLKAEARGKELLLTIREGEREPHSILVTMGMSGFWSFDRSDERPKHAHLHFNTSEIDGYSLSLVDPRRFAKWKWCQGWSANRGPCPVTQTSAFVKNIEANLHKSSFRNPIHLMLMDQRFFNGIGNYLRAEILFRADQDPFEEARTALVNNPKILQLCSQVPFEAYLIGGGQLKDWQNPFSVPAGGFRDWIQCYGKADTHIKDYNGRTFWYFQSQIKHNIWND